MFPRSGYSRFMPGSGRKYERFFTCGRKEGIMKTSTMELLRLFQLYQKWCRMGTENEW